MIERPIAHDLDTTPDEPRLHSAWRGVRERVARRRRAGTTRVVARLGVVVAAVVAVTLAALAWPEPEGGPLLHASGEPLSAAESIARPRALRLADASTIELETGARIEPLRNDGQRLELELTRGRARFEVTPGGPREWVIDGGLARIYVVGTAFVVDRDDQALSVEVEHGRVRVEGDTLTNPRILAAGERIELHAPRPSAAVEPDPPVAPNEEDATGEGQTRTDGEPALVESPRRAAAIQTEPPPPTNEVADEPAELLRAADLARRGGRVADAIEPLEAILRDHPDHPEAPLAAITLTRIQLTLGDHGAALGSLRVARRLGVPRLFDAEVCASMAFALEATGDLDAARSEANACLGRHGTPPHAEALRRLAGSP